MGIYRLEVEQTEIGTSDVYDTMRIAFSGNEKQQKDVKSMHVWERVHLDTKSNICHFNTVIQLLIRVTPRAVSTKLHDAVAKSNSAELHFIDDIRQVSTYTKTLAVKRDE